MNTADIVLGLVLSCIGLGYFMYGRRQARVAYRYCGIALMVFPYFVGDTWMMAAVGAGLLLLPRFVEL